MGLTHPKASESVGRPVVDPESSAVCLTDCDVEILETSM